MNNGDQDGCCGKVASAGSSVCQASPLGEVLSEVEVKRGSIVVMCLTGGLGVGHRIAPAPVAMELYWI